MSTNPTSCPCCGRAFPKPKAVAAPVALADLPDKDVFAYYKRTAPVEDVKFQLRLTSLPLHIRIGYEALLSTLEAQGGKATPATKRDYNRLQTQQRVYRPLVTARRLGGGWMTRAA